MNKVERERQTNQVQVRAYLKNANQNRGKNNK